MSIPAGASIGSVVVEHRIATDAWGELSLARQPALDRRVVLRRLSRDMLRSERLLDRFHREARYGARLNHPNVVQVYDCFAYGGDRYLMLEHVEGADLRSILERAGPVPLRIAARIAREVCRALREVHSRRLVHADVRPEQIHVSRWGDVKLGGFACARELGAAGPPPERGAYSPPELAADAVLGWGADAYAVGILLSELLSGHTGRVETGRDEAGQAHGTAAASPAGLKDRRISRLVRRCTDPDPLRRPSIRQIAAQLERRLPRASATDSRTEIAAWLWEMGMFRPREAASGELAERERIRPVRDTRSRHNPLSPRLPALVGAAAVAAAIGLWSWLTLSVEERPVDPGAPLASVAAPPERMAPAAPAPPNGPAEAQESASEASAGAGASPAWIQVLAYPWAQVEIDDAESVVTPHVEPIQVAPGVHRITFRHPSFGAAEERVEIEPGAHHIVRHVFLDPTGRGRQ